MPHFFEKRDPWGHGLGLWVLVGMAFTLPLAVWGVSRLRIDNSVEHWFADGTVPARQFAWYQRHFSADESVLVSWDDSALEDPRVEKFALRLMGTPDAEGIRRGGMPQIQAVQTPGRLVRRMLSQGIERDEAVRRVTGVLAGAGPIWCQFTTTGLNQKVRSVRMLREEAAKRFGLQLEISERFGGIGSESEEEDADADAEPEVAAVAAGAEAPSAEAHSAEASADSTSELASTQAVGEPLFDEIAVHDIQVSWRGMHSEPKVIAEFIEWAKTLRIPVPGQREGEALLTDCFVHPGQPAAIAVVFSEAGRADRRGTLEQIRQAAEEVGIPRKALHLGGTPVTTVALNQELSHSAWDPAAPWYILHQRSVLVCSWLVGLGLACWFLRSLRLAASILVVSYFITVLTIALVPTQGGTINMLLLVVPTLLLIVTLTGALHFANYWKHAIQSDPQTAIVRSLMAARLPCLMAAAGTVIALGSLLSSNLGPVRAFAFYSAIGTLISVVGVLFGIPALLQAWPVKPTIVTTAKRRVWTGVARVVVRHATACTIAWVMISAVAFYGFAKLRTEPKVLRYLADNSRVVQDNKFLEERLAGIVPVETIISFGREARDELNFTQRLEIVREVEQKMKALPDVSGATSLADYQPSPAGLPENASLKQKLVFNTAAQELETVIRKDPQARAYYLSPRESSEFNAAGDELWRITCQAPITSELDYRDLTKQLDVACRSVTKYHSDTQHVVTGMIPVFLGARQTMLDNWPYAFLLSLAGVSVLMMVTARNLFAGLLAMAPNVLPLVLVLGGQWWSGIPVDLTTLISAALALGITVSGTLHLLTWYREGAATGISRRRAVVRALECCGPALWQTGIAIGVAMLVLSSAPVPVVSRLGGLIASFTFTALLAHTILTPALLAGPLGWLVYAEVQKQRNKLKAVIEDPDPTGTMRHAPHVTPPKPQIAAESRPETGQFETRDSRQRKRRR